MRRLGAEKERLMEILIAVAGLVALALASLRYGCDSRPRFGA